MVPQSARRKQTMLRSFDTSVLIVGAGPVGLTLAMELASRGVDVTVTETRRAGEPPNVKYNQVSARSMEIFRRLGLADRIRNTGLPPAYRNDVAMCVSVLGTELSRIKLPSRAGRVRGEKGADGHWPCAEWGTASISSISSRCCSRTLRRSRASVSSTAPSSRN